MHMPFNNVMVYFTKKDHTLSVHTVFHNRGETPVNNEQLLCSKSTCSNQKNFYFWVYFFFNIETYFEL